MAITSAIKPINVGYNIWQVILQKLPKNIAGLTITVTPPVGVIVGLTFSSDLEEAMLETGKSLSQNSKISSVLEKYN